MRKQELVYLHGLLREVRDYYERETGEAVPTPQYDACDLSPSAIHRSKGDQEEAVKTLLEELSEAMESRQGARGRGLRPGTRLQMTPTPDDRGRANGENTCGVVHLRSFQSFHTAIWRQKMSYFTFYTNPSLINTEF